MRERHLEFRLGEVRIAVPAVRVREVTEAVMLHVLPGAPPTIEGVVDLRGTVVPVFDVRGKLGLPSRRLNPEESIVFLECDDRIVGFRVDETVGVVDLDERTSSLEDVFRGEQFLQGVGRVNGEIVLLHDASSFFNQLEAERLEASLDAFAESVEPVESGDSGEGSGHA